MDVSVGGGRRSRDGDGRKVAQLSRLSASLLAKSRQVVRLMERSLSGATATAVNYSGGGGVGGVDPAGSEARSVSGWIGLTMGWKRESERDSDSDQVLDGSCRKE